MSKTSCRVEEVGILAKTRRAWLHSFAVLCETSHNETLREMSGIVDGEVMECFRYKGCHENGWGREKVCKGEVLEEQGLVSAQHCKENTTTLAQNGR